MEKLFKVEFSGMEYLGRDRFSRLMTLAELTHFLEEESTKSGYAYTGRTFEVKIEYIPQQAEHDAAIEKRRNS